MVWGERDVLSDSLCEGEVGSCHKAALPDDEVVVITVTDDLVGVNTSMECEQCMEELCVSPPLTRFLAQQLAAPANSIPFHPASFRCPAYFVHLHWQKYLVSIDGHRLPIYKPPERVFLAG